MLRALGRGIRDLTETKVSISAFTKEISKTLGALPIDITMGSKTSLSVFFTINSTANYNALLGRDWIHVNWCVSYKLVFVPFFFLPNLHVIVYTKLILLPRIYSIPSSHARNLIEQIIEICFLMFK